MATQLLVNVVAVTLAPGASAVVAHELKSNNLGVVPTQVICDRASPIQANGLSTSTVTFTNLNVVSSATANFRCEFDPSIHAVGATPISWQGFVASGGPGGVAFSDLGLSPWNGTISGLSAGQLARFNGTNLVPAANNVGPTAGIYQLASDGSATIRVSGEYGTLRAEVGIVANDWLYEGLGGAATKTPLVGSGYSQKIGFATSPSVETSPGSGVYVVPAWIQLFDYAFTP